MALWDYDVAIGSLPVRERIESYLNQAIIADPDFALAYAQRAYLFAFSLNADAGTVDNFESRRVELEALALADLAMATSLDPGLGAPHRILARIHQYNWQGPQAQTAYARALELSPSDPRILADYALFNAMQGRHEDAIRLAQRAVTLDPNNGVYHHELAWALSYAGDFAAAAAANRRAIELSPTLPDAYWDLALYEGILGNSTEGLNRLRIAEQLLQDHTNLVLSGLLAYTYGRLGSTEDAARLLRRLEDESATRRVPSTAWIQAYLGVGDEDNALGWMNAAADDPPLYEGHFGMASIAANGYHDPVLDQPQFVEVRSRLGFRE
jgi:Flp pilus assembly protein TadD